MSDSNIGIQIGAHKDAINAARQGVIDILSAGHAGKTTRMALRTFAHIAGVNNVSVSDSQITLNAAAAGDPEADLTATT